MVLNIGFKFILVIKYRNDFLAILASLSVDQPSLSHDCALLVEELSRQIVGTSDLVKNVTHLQQKIQEENDVFLIILVPRPVPICTK